MQTLNVDIGIAGAGLAGLSAARTLVARGKSVVVFEAMNRVGGRTWSGMAETGDVVDGGGQWIGDDHHAILALARDLGVETFPTPDAGEHVVQFDRGPIRYGRGLPSFGPLRLFDTWQIVRRLDRAAAAVSLEAPWAGERAAALDRMSFGDWLARHSLTPFSRFLLRSACRLNIGADPADVSLLYVLFKIHSAGGFRKLTEVQDGGLARRFVPGSQALAQRMAAALGDRVHRRAPVRRIVHRAGHVEMVSDAITAVARSGIVAMDPASAGRVVYEPGLPAARRVLHERWTMKKARKIHVVYPTPFWRAAGFSGRLLLADSPVIAVYDNGRPRAPHGVLLVFSDFGSESDRRRATLEILAQVFGPAARDAIGYHEFDWEAEPWTSGCVSNPAPGVLTNGGEALRASVGDLHWASAETSPLWEGHMEGAVRAGQAVAERILAADA